MSDAPAERKLTKKEQRMLARQQAAEEKARKAAEVAKANAHKFGDAPLIQSRAVTGRVWTRLRALDKSLIGAEVLVRARLHHVRLTGKNVFVVLRQSFHTAQAITRQSAEIPAAMLKYIESVTRESIVEVQGTVVEVPKPLTGVSQSDVELRINTFHTISKADPILPFSMEDAARPVHLLEGGGGDSDGDGEGEAAGDGAAAGAGAGAGADDEPKFNRVSQKVRLDNRWIDLRTPANQAIFRISSGVCNLFREFLVARGFVEIQTPKLLGGASEGGSEVFKLKYFGQRACMAQSPQLYKQMCAAGGDFERVFEIGPVFRAEDSNTHRHLCEFHGMDMEMVFHEHYFEVLDVFSDLFIFIFDELNRRFKPEVEAVRAQYAFEDLKYLRPALRLTYAEGIKLLQEAGYTEAAEDADLTTPLEKALGAIVREKYDTDFYMMDKYPLSVRPFYTMPDPESPKLSNSYDFFIRGEEIVSGAQRIHDADMLAARAEEHGIPVKTIQAYVDSFKHGALPHAGGGIGLERVVMLFLGLGNIRKTALFPRDPKRLEP